jgi:hypothetical protein
MKPEQFQLLMMAVGPVVTLFGVFVALLMQNHHVDVRVGDLKELLRAEIRATHAEMRADFGELRVLIEKNHSETLARFAELDSRLARLESERRIVQ